MEAPLKPQHIPALEAVIMVCESATIDGGAEKVAIQESVELARRGVRVGYIAGNSQAAKELIDAGVKVLLLDTTSFFETSGASTKIQRMFFNRDIESRVLEFLKGFDPKSTVVHLHTFRLKLSGLVGHTTQKMGFPTFLHAHDYSSVCPTTLLYNYRENRNCELNPMSLACISCECQGQGWKYKLPKVTSYWWNQSIWKLNQRSVGIIHISQLEKETVTSRLSSPLPGFSLPPISNFSSETRVEAEANQSFLFVGRLTREKGADQFVAACGKAGVPAVVIGDGPLRSELEQQFPEARFTGWLTPDQIREELLKARALVVPSQWRETLCLSVIDAMSLGVPCIVSEFVGAKEFIEDGESGTIFEEGRLVEAILKMSEPGYVARLSEGAFKAIQENPKTVGSHVDCLIDIYRSCLENSHAS